MKIFFSVFIFTGLWFLHETEAKPQIRKAPSAEKTCLPVSRKSVPLLDFNTPSMAKVSPDGRWLLYGGGTDENKKVTPVILMDLSTEKKIEFFPSHDFSLLESKFHYNSNSGYGFTNKGTLAWIQSNKDSDIKLKSLPDGEEKWIHRDTNYYIIESGIKEDIGILWSMGFDKNYLESLLALEQELKSKSPLERAKLEKELEAKGLKINLVVQLVDMSSLSKIKKTLPDALGTCSRIDHSLNFLHVRRDGSLYKTDLKTDSDPVELFGPVEGLQIPNFREDTKGLVSQCVIDLSGLLNVIRKPEGGFLLRVIEEGKEFHLPDDIFNLRFLSNGEVHTLPRYFNYLYDIIQNFIRYPFIVSSSAMKISPSNLSMAPYIMHSSKALLKNVTEWLIYHIPSQTTQIKQNTKLLVNRQKGSFALEDLMRGKDEIIQAVFQPFDLEKRQVLMELNSNEACLVKIDEETNQAFLNTVWGDLFIIDMKTGSIIRRDVGRCLSEVNTVSEHTLILQNRDQSYIAHKFQDRCFEPESSTIDMKQALSHVAKAAEPTDTNSLALLVAALENDSMKDHPKLTRQALWNILSRSFTLFLHLYRRFPNLSQMPVLPIIEDLDPERKKKLEASTDSLLKFTTEEYRMSRLSDWKFLNLLHPFLDSLSEEDKNLYMEKITVSITNGSTKAIPLLRDVFQSKLYYVAQGHIKELFGSKRQSVSDITLVRKGPKEWSLPSEAQTSPNPHLENQSPSSEEEKNYTSFIVPVILSSDPIEGVSDTATDFGIHYAVLEKSIRPVLKNQKMGTQLLNEKVEWNLPKNGSHYRAHFSVSVKQIRNKLIGNLESPDYDSIWKDHKMVGAVIVGSSLYGFSKTLLEEYLSYFQNQGFQFSKAKTTNLKEFLLEGIKNCELDYFLKESHSDGDERNIFRFNRTNYIAKGVRYGEEGRIEVVYIIFPPPLSLPGLKTDLLSNKELGQAIKEREHKGCGQLTYFNTSCWSDVKARYEIEAVNSPLFLNIPSISLTDTFLNIEGEAIHSLLQSYRKGLDFDGFREALKTNEGYRLKKSNLYIFPDEVLYHAYIFNLTSVPLDINIKLERKEGETWLPLDPDEAL